MSVSLLLEFTLAVNAHDTIYKTENSEVLTHGNLVFPLPLSIHSDSSLGGRSLSHRTLHLVLVLGCLKDCFSGPAG